MSDTRWKIYQLIKNHIATYDYAPSIRYIADDVGLRSPATVAHHIGKLEEAGYIKRLGKPARIIVLGDSDWTQ